MAQMILQLILLVTLCGVILGAPYPDGTDHKLDDATNHHHDHDHNHDHDHDSQHHASDGNARKSEVHDQTSDESSNNKKLRRDTTQQQSKQGPPPAEVKDLPKQTATLSSSVRKTKRDTTAKKEEHTGGSTAAKPLTQLKDNTRSTQAPKHKREANEEKPKLTTGPLDSSKSQVHTNVDGKPVLISLPAKPGPPGPHGHI